MVAKGGCTLRALRAAVVTPSRRRVSSTHSHALARGPGRLESGATSVHPHEKGTLEGACAGDTARARGHRDGRSRDRRH